jgi:hypothetical protein
VREEEEGELIMAHYDPGFHDAVPQSLQSIQLMPKMTWFSFLIIKQKIVAIHITKGIKYN